MKSQNPSAVTVSNILSLTRVPLAFVFLLDEPLLRCLAIGLAILTDCLDGFLARRFRQVSQLGAVIDPLTDRFFVILAFAVFITEDRLSLLGMTSLLCRDFAIIFFGIYLYLKQKWKGYQFHAIWCGKATTALQFLVLTALSLGYSIPPAVFGVFIALGCFTFVELYLPHTQTT